MKRMGFGTQPFPTTKDFFLRAYDEVHLVAPVTAGYPAYFIINMNGMNDFDSGGQQPYYYDQLQALYQNYQVERFHFEIEFHTPSSAENWLAGVYCAPSSTLNPISRDLGFTAEKLGADCRIFNDKVGKLKIQGVIDLPSLLGKTLQTYRGMDEYISTFTSNPSNLLYFYVLARPTDSGTDQPTLEASITLHFYGRAWENKNVVHS
jgi:hypothetical protein